MTCIDTSFHARERQNVDVTRTPLGVIVTNVYAWMNFSCAAEPARPETSLAAGLNRMQSAESTRGRVTARRKTRSSKTSGSADYLPVICVADSKPSGELTHKLSRYNITIRKKTPTQARGEYWVPAEDEARSEDQNAVEMSTSQKLKYADSSNKSKSLKNTLFRFLYLEIFWI